VATLLKLALSSLRHPWRKRRVRFLRSAIGGQVGDRKLLKFHFDKTANSAVSHRLLPTSDY